MLINLMSAEKIINTENENFITSRTSDIDNKKNSVRVDINHLFARVRKEQQRENKINIIFFVLFTMLILIVGIFLSL